jgi:hypothetical protein
MTRLVWVLPIACGVALAAAACNLHAEEPRQRQDYSDPPVQYGQTRFPGMRLPSATEDAGADAP